MLGAKCIICVKHFTCLKLIHNIGKKLNKLIKINIINIVYTWSVVYNVD